MLNADGSDNKIRPRLRQLFLWAGLVSIVMLPRLLDLEVFIGPDELTELGRDNHFALALAQMDWAGTLIGDGKPSVTLMWVNTIGVGIKWLWLQLSGASLSFVQVVDPSRPFELWAERRMFLALVSGLQILAAWPLLRIVWNERVATIGVGLMAIEPFLLAFTRMIRGDSLLAGFMLLSVLGALAFVKTGQPRYNWFSGVMGGLAVLTKLSGGVLAPTIVLIYAAAALRRLVRGERPGWRRFVGAVLGWGIPSAIVFFGLWPAWWVRPTDTFRLLWDKLAYHAVDAAAEHPAIYFWGELHPLGPGPWFYVVLALLRLTPWLLLGGIAAVGRWVWQARQFRFATADWSLLAIGLYVATYWLTITMPGQKIDRFFVPIIPGLAVLTAIEITMVAQWLAGRQSSHLPPLVLSLVAMGVGGAMLGHVAFFHPLYSTYFDPLVGNSKFWQWALPVGNGEGVDEALKHLSSLPGAADKTVVCGTDYPRCRPFFTGQLWHQEDLRSHRWFEADYVLWHLDEQQRELFPAEVLAYLRRQPEIYVASYHGIDYTWLYPVPRPSYFTGGSKLEGVATLLGYDVAEKALDGLSPGDQLSLHVYWQNEGQASQQQFWWRVVDGEGYVWNEETAQPLAEFEAVAAQDGAIVEGQASLSLPSDMPPGTYTLKAGFADARGDVGQFALPPEGSLLQVTGVPLGETRPSHVVDEALTSDLRLRGYDLSRPESVPGETLWLALYWQAIGQPQRDYVINLRLLDEVGGEVTSWSGRPVYNTFPTRQWAANAHVRDPWRITLPSDLPPGRYQFSLSLRDASGPAELAQVDLGSVQVVERRTSFDVPPMQFQADQSFGDVAMLLGYDLSGELAPDGAHLSVTLYWRALRTTDQPYTVNVRLVDANGLVLAEQESAPGGGVVSTTGWQVGEIITDLHPMDVARSQPASVNLEVRLWDASGRSVPTQSGTEAWIVSDVQQKVMWRVSAP
jgi:hypothetical protein